MSDNEGDTISSNLRKSSASTVEGKVARKHYQNSCSGSHIQTFLRIRPSRRPSGYFAINEENTSQLSLTVPVDLKPGETINNTKSRYDFQFSSVFGPKATQNDVFSRVGEPAVLTVLDGINSTVFAYGQTGSGKTFSITGGAERYNDRGIIPRALNLLFDEINKQKGIGRNSKQGYDLLDSSQDNKKFEELRKIQLMEDENGNIHLKNLSMYPVSTEEDALSLLFVGDTNRAISETAMNKQSSRSHCIFTVAVTHSKLHLVDLAGSERVHKTSSTGQILTEAKFINSSLHFLELVIVALHDKGTIGRRHIPYRNSMMTSGILTKKLTTLSVLRDSLGGNCKTIMLATINPEAEQTEESISTCRFAQRVSLIRNVAVVNEVIDPQLTIRRLKSEISALKAQLAMVHGEVEETNSTLTTEERHNLQSQCERFIQEVGKDESLAIGEWTYSKVTACFEILKDIVLEGRMGNQGLVLDANELGSSRSFPGQELREIREILQQKEKEIAVLVNMVKQGRHTSFPQNLTPAISNSIPNSIEVNQQPTARGPEWEIVKLPGRNSRELENVQNKSILCSKYEEAKTTGERVNQARSSINYLKNTIEQIRRERAVGSLVSDRGYGNYEEDLGEQKEADEEEDKYKTQIENKKVAYKDNFHHLRQLKSEIDLIQHLLNKSREKIQRDFGPWYEAALAKEGHGDERGDAIAASPVAPLCPTVGPYNNHREQLKVNTSNNNNISKCTTTCPRVLQTGNEDTDKDIEAFYKAKEILRNRTEARS